MFTKKSSLTKVFVPVLVLLVILGFNERLFAQQEPNATEDVFEMSLEELMEVTVASPAALTKTRPRLVPAAVTTITEDMIRRCGARNLNEVFDIYVPNVQIMRHHTYGDHVGIRGLINDHDNKYLLLVNGRIMNQRTTIGAASERDLPMLADIHHIDFVRGPGSVIHGPGAMVGVISIVTHSALTFEGTEIIARQGFIEKFRSYELRHGIKLGDDRGLLVYYGLADYRGAEQKDSPYVFGKTFQTPDGDYMFAGHSVSFNIANDRQAYRGKLKHKFHLQYTDGPLDIWLRYTQGGQRQPPHRKRVAWRKFDGVKLKFGERYAGENLGDILGSQWGYQQVTAYASYKYEFSDYLSVDVAFSYDMFDFELLPYTYDTDLGDANVRSMREEEYYARVLGRWIPNDKHSVALGFEYSHERFGHRSPGYPHLPPLTDRMIDAGLAEGYAPWRTDTYSLFGEYQWNINEQWTTFLGGRLDNHTYTDWMFSPRAALVHTPTDKDTFKLIANRSVRRSEDDELRYDYFVNGEYADEEIIESIELRYERQHTDRLWLAAGFFYQDSELVTRNSTQNRNVLTAEHDMWGLELEASYRTEKSRIDLSHSLTELIDFKLVTPGEIQGYSADPYGYGSDLANWSNHITKLYASYDIDPKWKVDGSLRIYWGFPGAKDWSDYNYDENVAVGDKPETYHLAEPGYQKAFRPNMYLNLGLEHHPTENLTVRLDAHNVLGWFDENLNKRNYLTRAATYRCEAPAFSLTLRYMF